MGSRWLSCLVLVILLVPGCAATSAGADSLRANSAAGDGGKPPQGEPSKPQPFYERFFGQQLPVSATSRDWTISLSGSVSCDQCFGGKAWVIKAAKRDGKTYEIRVTKSPVQVDELALVDESKLVVFGRDTENAVVVNVLGLPEGVELDSFMCYTPALSPDHRFLTYVKMFPGHPGPVEITNEYIAYDLTESAASNRVDLGRGMLSDAGIPFYPPGATNAPGEFTAPDEWSAHVMVSRGLFWLGRTDNVAFVDRWRGTNSVIVADLSQGVRHPKMTVQALDTGTIVDLADCRNKVAPSDFENWSENPAGLVSVTDITLSLVGVPHVRLTLAPHPCLVLTTVDIPVRMSP
jgi:hypothetical protein